MKKITKYMQLCLFVFAFWACYEDKGHYDHIYSNIEKLNCYSRQNVSTVTLGDTVKIFPSITWVSPDVDTLAYDFFYVFSGDTICRERNLIIVPDEVGSFTGYLIAQERATKLMTMVSVSYTVNSRFKTGWLILSEKEGRTALSMLIQTRNYYNLDEGDEGYVDYENGDITESGEVYGGGYLYSWEDGIDLYQELHPDSPLGSKPVSVDMGWVGYSNNYAEIVVIQENGDNWVLNANDFSKYYAFNEDFGSGVARAFEPVQFIDALTSHYMVGKDGSIYWRKINASTMDSRQCRWENLLYFGNNGKITKIFDTWIYKLGAMLVYDETNKAIIPVTTVAQTSESAAARLLDITYGETIPDGFVLLGNTGEYTPVYVASIGSSSDYNSSTLFMLLKKGDKLYSQQCYAYVDYYSGVFKISKMQAPVEFPADGKVNENSIYMKCKYDSDYMFVAEGSRLYFYEMSIPERGLRLFKDFGSRITSVTENPASWMIGVALENGEFHLLGTYDRFFTGEGLGEQATYHVTKGLGKITDVVWKPSSYVGWAFGFNY